MSSATSTSAPFIPATAPVSTFASMPPTATKCIATVRHGAFCSPALAEYLKDPNNAAVSRDDVHQLGLIEGTLTEKALDLVRGVPRACSMVKNLCIAN